MESLQNKKTDEDSHKIDYFTLHDTLSRNASLNFIVGHRSAGKTYSFKDWSIRDWLKTGAEFAYVRRYKEELSTKETLFDDIAYKYDLEVNVRGWRAYARKIPKPGLSEKEIVKNYPWKPFGYFMALSQAQKYKGTNIPRVNKLCLDEFIIENRRLKYLINEVDMLISLGVTIDRDRNDLRIVCLSNAGYIDNPYFAEYGIKSHEIAKKEWMSRNNGSVLFHNYKTSNENRGKLLKTNMAKIAPDKYNEYAYDSVFFDNNDSFVKHNKPKGYELAMVLTNGTRTLGVYKPTKRFITDDSTIWVNEVKSVDNMLSVNPSEPIENARYSSTIINMYRKHTHNLLVTYASPEARIYWYDFIKP